MWVQGSPSLASRGTADADALDRVEIEIEERGNRVVVETDYPGHRRSFLEWLASLLLRGGRAGTVRGGGLPSDRATGHRHRVVQRSPESVFTVQRNTHSPRGWCSARTAVSRTAARSASRIELHDSDHPWWFSTVAPGDIAAVKTDERPMRIRRSESTASRRVCWNDPAAGTTGARRVTPVPWPLVAMPSTSASGQQPLGAVPPSSCASAWRPP